MRWVVGRPEPARRRPVGGGVCSPDLLRPPAGRHRGWVRVLRARLPCTPCHRPVPGRPRARGRSPGRLTDPPVDAGEPGLDDRRADHHDRGLPGQWVGGPRARRLQVGQCCGHLQPVRERGSGQRRHAIRLYRSPGPTTKIDSAWCLTARKTALSGPGGLGPHRRVRRGPAQRHDGILGDSGTGRRRRSGRRRGGPGRRRAAYRPCRAGRLGGRSGCRAGPAPYERAGSIRGSPARPRGGPGDRRRGQCRPSGAPRRTGRRRGRGRRPPDPDRRAAHGPCAAHPPGGGRCCRASRARPR